MQIVEKSRLVPSSSLEIISFDFKMFQTDYFKIMYIKVGITNVMLDHYVLLHII